MQAGSRLYTNSASSYRAGYIHDYVNHIKKESALIRPSAEVLHSSLPTPMFVYFLHQCRL
jgi:hypothetical protein